MSRDDGRLVTDEFLNTYFMYNDEEYERRLRKFHDNVQSLYGITSNSTLAELNKAKGMKRTFQQGLQDETTRRLYRFLESVLNLGVPNLPEFLSPSFERWLWEKGNKSLDIIFKGKFVLPWRNMDLWIVDEPSEYERLKTWPQDSPVLSIELTAWCGDHEDEVQIKLPLVWLSEKVIRNPLSDSCIASLFEDAKVDHEYNKLFGAVKTRKARLEMLRLIDEMGLRDKVQSIIDSQNDGPQIIDNDALDIANEED